MASLAAIDRTFGERLGIVGLLEGLAADDPSAEELDRLGTVLAAAGERALAPLLRRIGRERDGDRVARFAALLDFFPPDLWREQLTAIALRRGDLGEEGRLALLVALADGGVDITLPPFSGDGLAEAPTLAQLLDRGEEGLLLVLDDLLGRDGDGCRELIRHLPDTGDERVLPLLEALLAVDDQLIRREAATALGRIRRPAAAALLQGLLDGGDGPVRTAAATALRRLAFAGIAVLPATPRRETPYHQAWASWPDTSGFSAVWISRWAVDGTLDGLYLHIHDEQGICAAWGSSGLSPAAHDDRLLRLQGDEGVVAVPVEYARGLIRDGSRRNREQHSFLPAAVYLRHRLLAGDEPETASRQACFTGYRCDLLARDTRLVAAGGELFDHDAFAGWYLAADGVYDLAEEWQRLETEGGRRQRDRGLEELAERFITELCLPDLAVLVRRLRTTAEMLVHTGAGRDTVELVLAAAESMAGGTVPLPRHPFLQRLALESMDMAREALAEGYDPRRGERDGNDTGE